VARKQTKQGKRYSAAERKNILATAAKENLTGAQVRQKFGISTLTFYRWRGPVPGRKKRAKAPGRKPAASNQLIQEQVRQTIQEVLPGVIRTEIAAYLDRVLPRRGVGRPRKKA
jgi:transposase-like protein